LKDHKWSLEDAEARRRQEALLIKILNKTEKNMKEALKQSSKLLEVRFIFTIEN